MGSAAAHALAVRKADVVLLEQFELGHRLGSSAGATRILRLAYPEPDYVRLGVRALDAWRRLEQLAGEPLLQTTGGLDAGWEAELCAAAFAECGVAHEWLSAAEAAPRFPWLSLDGIERILYHPQAGVCLCERTILVQAELARRAGAEVRERTRVLAVEVHDDAVVIRTEAQELRASVAVVAAGGWSAQLLDPLRVPLALESTLTHVAYFRPLAGDTTATFVETDAERPEWYSYVVPDGGSGVGVKVGQQLGLQPIDLDRERPPVNEEWIDAHRDYVRRRLPGLDPEPCARETCIYAASTDDDFILDRVGPLVIAAGFGGHGFKFTPLVGEVVADLALGRQPDLPPQRFQTRRLAVATATQAGKAGRA